MYEFVDNWSSNQKVVEKVKEYLPSYLAQFKLEDQHIICKLLQNVEYYSQSKMEEELEKYFKIIKGLIKILQINYEVCVPFVDSKVNHNSSKILAYCPNDIKLINNVLNLNFSTINSLIVLDDYCGSGNTIKEFLKKLDNIVNKAIDIYYCPIFIVEKTLEELKTMSFNNLILKIFEYKINIAFCLSENNIFTEEEKEEFIKICKSKHIADIHGYFKIEDKFSTKYFTPNNSIGILWYSDRLYKPLFKRNGQNLTKPVKFLTNDKIEEFNEIILHTSDVEKIKKAKVALLLYNNYTFDEIENFLGIENLNEIIISLVEENILKESNGKYCFYKNLDKYFRKDKSWGLPWWSNGEDCFKC